MAELRVRLKFDYPPPSEPHSRHMWMLLNPEHLRTVTDLSDLIRARYYPSQRGALCLYVHDCLLPPGESARLIRDNDVIRVQWIGHDPEDDDSGNQERQSKKRSRQRYEEEEAPTMTPRKQKWEELSEGSKRKAKKKKMAEERAQEETAATEILSLLGPTKRVRARSGSSSHEETSTIGSESSGISLQPITTIQLKNPSRMTLSLFAALSVKKKPGAKNLPTLLSINKPPEVTICDKKPSKSPPTPINESSSNDSDPSSDQETSTKPKEPPKVLRKPEAINSTKKMKSKNESSKRRESSSNDSEPSSDHETSTKPKEPPKVLRKPEAINSTKKMKSKHGFRAENATVMSPSESSTSSSDQESSTIGKKASKVLSKSGTTVSINQNLSNHKSGATASHAQELSMARKNPVEATSNPLEAIAGKTSFSGEMRNRKDSSTGNNGGTGTSRLVDGVMVSPHSGAPSPGCASDTRPVEAQCLSTVHPKHGANPAVSGRGRGRGMDFFPWRGQGGRGFRGRGEQRRGRGTGSQFFHNYDSAALKRQQLEEAATNTSVIIENPPETPGRDYDSLPLLAAPPQVGKVMAFRILELNENYSPELSDYKEGVVCGYDHVTQQIELQLLSKQKKREPGKFDLVYESEDGQEIVEFAVPPECKITEAWSSLVTPRLVMEKGSEEGTLS